MQRSNMIHFPSWAVFVPAIHVFLAAAQDVDARDKPGHDERSIHRSICFAWRVDEAIADGS
jgi:hypothetical protein